MLPVPTHPLKQDLAAAIDVAAADGGRGERRKAAATSGRVPGSDAAPHLESDEDGVVPGARIARGGGQGGEHGVQSVRVVGEVREPLDAVLAQTWVGGAGHSEHMPAEGVASREIVAVPLHGGQPEQWYAFRASASL